MMYRSLETADVVRVKRAPIDAADSTARPEKIRLIVLIYKYMSVERPVPAFRNRRCVLPFAEDSVWAKRVIRNIYRAIIACHIEFPFVESYVRCDRHLVHLMKCPVGHVFGNPGSAACTEHIIHSTVFED